MRKPARRAAPKATAPKRAKARVPAQPVLSADIYRAMVESSPTAVILADREGRIVLVNRRAEALFGYRREELLGRAVEALLPERYRERHVAYRDAYARAPETRAMGAGRELYGLRKDGREVPVEIGLNPIFTPGGVFLLAAIVDITERKRSEERFRLAVEAAPNAMVMTGGDGRIVLANAQAEKLFGYGQAELLGKPIEVLVPARARGTHAHDRSRYMKAPEVREMGVGRELFAVRKDGREIPVEIGLNPIRSEGETFVLAAVVDITERRELQRKVAQSEALAAVGSMASVLAHEIRNPLGSIVMAARSLGHDDLTEEDRGTVSRVLTEESQRLNRTLQDFLQFARPREPRRDLADLNALVAETVEALKADAGLMGRVELRVSLDSSLPPFPHDQDQIRQVLWNLLLNGVQAMEGEGRLEVGTRAVDGQARVQVTDSGAGLPADAADKIFDPFFTTKKKGTGLGLAICRRIVDAHGGRLTAENARPGGARFSMLLPLGKPRRS